jgi:hypothetical protein
VKGGSDSRRLGRRQRRPTEGVSGQERDGTPPPKEGSRLGQWLGRNITLATALVALAVASANGLYTIVPAWSPDPKTKVGGTLTSLALDRSVTYGDFVARHPQRRRPGIPETREGNVLYISASVEGFKRENLRLRWFVYDKINQRRVRGLGSTAELEEVFKPQAPVNTQIAQVWVPAPSQTGDYFVRIELYTEDGTVLLAFVDSPSFHVESL